MNDEYIPSEQDIKFLNDAENGYIGTAPINKTGVKHIYEPDPDPNYYKRRKAAQRLGLEEKELHDEPDNSPEAPEQAWA